MSRGSSSDYHNYFSKTRRDQPEKDKCACDKVVGKCNPCHLREVCGMYPWLANEVFSVMGPIHRHAFHAPPDAIPPYYPRHVVYAWIRNHRWAEPATFDDPTQWFITDKGDRGRFHLGKALAAYNRWGARRPIDRLGKDIDSVLELGSFE